MFEIQEFIANETFESGRRQTKNCRIFCSDNNILEFVYEFAVASHIVADIIEILCIRVHLFASNKTTSPTVLNVI